MRLSTLFGRTLREAPADAENVAYQLVLRAGLAQPLMAGSYALLPLGMRVVRQIETIIHEEMGQIGGQEFRTPIIQASTAWEQSGRYSQYGPLMLRLSDRTERALIVAPTHEEAVADLARREITSYRQMPALIYQVHTKYRDELRAKGGLMRLREFTMMDAYSLDADSVGLDHVYEHVSAAFERIFARCGIRFVAVEAAAGEMGGRDPREYMALSSIGEDTLVICSKCGYAANLEIATSATATHRDSGAATVEDTLTEVATPNCTTIAELAAFLGVPESTTAKAVFFDTPERGLLFAVIRGDLEVNEAKLRAVAEVSALVPASAEQIVAVGAVPGYASPIGLHDVMVIADQSVVEAGPLVAGANRAGYHLRNVVYGRDWQARRVADIATVQEGYLCTRCSGTLHLERGIEIGHVFKLDTRYSQALGSVFLDQSGKAQPIVMGSYGIGIERLLQVIVEQHHDEAGIVWPVAVAPFEVHLLTIGKKEDVRAAGERLYLELSNAGLRVLYDDREETAGVKFNDADLLGLPVRLVISERLLTARQVEVKPRVGTAQLVDDVRVIEAIKAVIARGR